MRNPCRVTDLDFFFAVVPYSLSAHRLRIRAWSPDFTKIYRISFLLYYQRSEISQYAASDCAKKLLRFLCAWLSLSVSVRRYFSSCGAGISAGKVFSRFGLKCSGQTVKSNACGNFARIYTTYGTQATVAEAAVSGAEQHLPGGDSRLISGPFDAKLPPKRAGSWTGTIR